MSLAFLVPNTEPRSGIVALAFAPHTKMRGIYRPGYLPHNLLTVLHVPYPFQGLCSE
jgi:hypothetical protein